MGYEVFRKLCEEKGVTPYKVAQDLGFSRGTFSDWKAGRSTPKLAKMSKIAEYFHVSVDIFYKESPNEEVKKEYYFDEQTAKIAQAIFEDKNRRILFDATSKMTPQQVKALADFAMVTIQNGSD